jgi:hypothetical protein
MSNILKIVDLTDDAIRRALFAVLDGLAAEHRANRKGSERLLRMQERDKRQVRGFIGGRDERIADAFACGGRSRPWSRITQSRSTALSLPVRTQRSAHDDADESLLPNFAGVERSDFGSGEVGASLLALD